MYVYDDVTYVYDDVTYVQKGSTPVDHPAGSILYLELDVLLGTGRSVYVGLFLYTLGHIC